MPWEARFPTPRPPQGPPPSKLRMAQAPPQQASGIVSELLTQRAVRMTGSDATSTTSTTTTTTPQPRRPHLPQPPGQVLLISPEEGYGPAGVVDPLGQAVDWQPVVPWGCEVR